MVQLCFYPFLSVTDDLKKLVIGLEKRIEQLEKGGGGGKGQFGA